jgi:serine/threonine protein kinase/Tol biopolymer transport system component
LFRAESLLLGSSAHIFSNAVWTTRRKPRRAFGLPRCRPTIQGRHVVDDVLQDYNRATRMALSSGTKLGPYEIQTPLGAGGMGEVYRAHDSKLGREVAIKILPEAFARDADRMARFKREAKVLASLNHPNIASIYGLEDSETTYALVMELVEGPTLADRIRQGPIPIDEAVPIAKQICDALEYAHERGIVHRDLKPANVKVTVDDAVKVLDFGLAKAIEGDASSIDAASSPTISRMATLAGVLLGTAAYMSPEQAKAKPVDRRADIWAFGCVLYEMLTGKMAFRGESVTDTLAAIIKEEADWSQLPAATPMRVRVLLRRCLQKDPKQRLRDIGDARISLEEVLSGAQDPASSLAARPARRRMLPWAAVVFLTGIVFTSIVVWDLKPSPSRPVTRAVITLPPGQRLAGLTQPALALSPDGTDLAYVAATIQPGGTQQIYLRQMDSLESKALPGTEGGVAPFFSPDGRWLGFFAEGRLKKVSVNGGVALTISDAAYPGGAAWDNRGMIFFIPTAAFSLQQVSEGGGAAQPLIRSGKTALRQRWPDFLPGGKALLFTAGPTASNWSNAQVAVQLVRTGEQRELIQGGTHPRYVPPGYLAYAQGGNLMAAPFDVQRLEVTGAAVPVVQEVMQSPVSGAAQYSVSATGSLVYVSGGNHAAQRKLVWVSRSGAEQALEAPVHSYVGPRISPDGRQIAVSIQERDSQIWLYDLSRQTLHRLTFDGNINNSPAWTSDGKRIAFTSTKDGPLNICWQLADGSGAMEKLNTSENTQVPISWSPDGKLLAFLEVDPTTGYDIGVLHLDNRKVESFLRTPSNESVPRFSPDGRWLAYISDESGRYEIYVQPYPGPGGKRQISSEGGTEPTWNPSGGELFYRNGNKMMAVEVTTQPSFVAGKPQMLFEGPYATTALTNPNYAVSSDGKRFLMLKSAEQGEAEPTQIKLVLNWTEELKRLVPPGK